MIDFPASPTDGQIFSATNGVVYRWSATYSSWLAQNAAPPLGGTGDFTAVTNGVLPTTAAVIVFPTVQNGNAGGWLNLSTGRYTPPAGRYVLYAFMSASCNSAAGALVVNIRKNAAVIATATTSTAATGFNGNVNCETNADANGADFFDVTVSGAPASVTASNITFGAFPLTGMQGPTGGAPGPVVGDFNAQFVGPTGIPSTATLITGIPVTVGNGGGYYTPANGQYRPPAGRYFIYAKFYGGSASAAANIQLQLLKNGAVIDSTFTTTGAAAFQTMASVEATVDANGSDIFTLTWLGSSSSSASFATFGAFPTQGMVGPQGPQGPPGGTGTGDVDVMQTGAWTIPVAGSDTVMPFDTVLVGNAGLWWSTSTNRYTPPAGRYSLQAWAMFNVPAGVSAGIALRKNGVRTSAGYVQQNTGTVARTLSLNFNETVDANGADYFEWVTNVGSATTWGGSHFSAFPLTGMQGPTGPAGVTQTVFFETGAMATGTTLIPADDTIPQITEGNEFMTLSITPQSATSKLIIDVTCSLANDAATAATLCAALFQDSTANALAVGWFRQPSAGLAQMISFKHTMTSGTTSATTFRIRGGCGTTGTTTFNGASATRFYGGVLASSIVIRETP